MMHGLTNLKTSWIIMIRKSMFQKCNRIEILSEIHFPCFATNNTFLSHGGISFVCFVITNKKVLFLL